MTIPRKRGFTLIELLVVISIISLLASVILASLSGATDKARIAAAAEFEAHTLHSIGDHLVGQWVFEEGSGAVAKDSSGGGNDASFLGSVSWSTDTYDPAASKYSLLFSGGYLVASKGLGIANSNFTIAEWVKTTDGAGQLYNIGNAGSSNGYRFGPSNGRVGFLVGNGTVYTENTCGTKVIDDGTWHFIAGVFDRTAGKFICYVDGTEAGQVAIQYDANMSDAPPYIGAWMPSRPFDGEMDNVRIYAADLSDISLRTMYEAERSEFVALR